MYWSIKYSRVKGGIRQLTVYIDLEGQINRAKVETGERRFKKVIWTEELKEKFEENLEQVDLVK